MPLISMTPQMHSLPHPELRPPNNSSQSAPPCLSVLKLIAKDKGLGTSEQALVQKQLLLHTQSWAQYPGTIVLRELDSWGPGTQLNGWD